MGKLKLVADSASDLMLEQYNKYDIELVPLNVYVDNKEYKDIIGLESKELFRLMGDEDKMPTTSQSTPADFKRVFDKCIKEGFESIIYIAFSSNLSGTYQSSLIAAQEFEDKDITIIDSKCASLGYGLVVLEAAEMIKEGKSKDEVIKAVDRKKAMTEHVFTVDNLKYLQKGGRISFTKAMLGTMLNLKPVMHVEEGRLFPYSKARGKHRVLCEMLKIMQERVTDETKMIGICNAACKDKALELESMIRESFPNANNIIHTDMGGAVGSHVGPGCLALFFEGKHEYVNVETKK